MKILKRNLGMEGDWGIGGRECLLYLQAQILPQLCLNNLKIEACSEVGMLLVSIFNFKIDAIEMSFTHVLGLCICIGSSFMKVVPYIVLECYVRHGCGEDGNLKVAKMYFLYLWWHLGLCDLGCQLFDSW